MRTAGEKNIRLGQHVYTHAGYIEQRWNYVVSVFLTKNPFHFFTPFDLIDEFPLEAVDTGVELKPQKRLTFNFKVAGTVG